ncbi:uncharacterized protein LOC143352648 isoform X1 [Halictus rubicundus]|uniref:uncharacterized protein LOC143352648 isoform X1 n=1 Tax=Halictus rubicundus TaxID=77578 RepID=UPI004036D21A
MNETEYVTFVIAKISVVLVDVEPQLKCYLTHICILITRFNENKVTQLFIVTTVSVSNDRRAERRHFVLEGLFENKAADKQRSEIIELRFVPSKTGIPGLFASYYDNYFTGGGTV